MNVFICTFSSLSHQLQEHSVLFLIRATSVRPHQSSEFSTLSLLSFFCIARSYTAFRHFLQLFFPKFRSPLTEPSGCRGFIWKCIVFTHRIGRAPLLAPIFNFPPVSTSFLPPTSFLASFTFVIRPWGCEESTPLFRSSVFHVPSPFLSTLPYGF